MLTEKLILTCPSCGHRWPEDFFINGVCKLCYEARREEAARGDAQGLYERTLLNRPPNENRLRGIR